MLDLDLVKVFIAIYETGGVSKAAQRLHLSQPSITYNLNRLRKYVDDELFKRTKAGMTPTQIATNLYPVLSASLFDIENAISSAKKFNPMQSNRIFRIGLSDVGEVLLLPRLIKYFSLCAPHARLEIEEIEIDKIENWLSKGFLDAAIYTRHNTSSQLNSYPLFHESYQCLMHKDHPRIQDSLSLEQYLNEQHIAIKACTGHLNVDHILKQLQMERKIALQVPHFSVLYGVLVHSPLLVTVPSRLVQAYDLQNSFKSFDLPFPVPNFEISVNWHPHSTDILARQWFIDTLKMLFSGF
jgi:DNA-binding transcriptional LysR family regulator